MEKKPAHHIQAAHYRSAASHLQRREQKWMAQEVLWRQADNLMQVTIALVNDRVVVPGLSGPKPDPARAANKGADDNQQYPHQKAPTEHGQRKPSLFDCVIAIAERARIHVGENH